MRDACRALLRVLRLWPQNLKRPVDKDLQLFTNQMCIIARCSATSFMTRSPTEKGSELADEDGPRMVIRYR